MLTACRAVKGLANQLHEETACGLGMKEGDSRSHSSRPRGIIDHPHPAAEQVGNCFLEVRHLDGDVMKPRPPALKETADHPWPGRLEQLQVRIADRQHAFDESLRRLFACEWQSEQVGEQVRSVVCLMREGNVVQAGDSPGPHRLLGPRLVRYGLLSR